MSRALIKHYSVDFDGLNVTISNLETLKLARNKLSLLKQIFFIKAPTLRYLDVSENLIASIDHDIAKIYPGLVILNVQDNDLTTLSGLESLDFLQNLYAAGNRITEVPTWLVSEARNFKILDLSNNPLQCTCNINHLKKWILSDKQT